MPLIGLDEKDSGALVVTVLMEPLRYVEHEGRVVLPCPLVLIAGRVVAVAPAMARRV